MEADLFLTVSASEETAATNELIDDNPDLVTSTQTLLLSSEEIAELRNQGFTAEDIIQMQMERHDRFGLKTEYSKDKWKKRKEKKWVNRTRSC
jgi:tRNA (adenine-N(1)-)-methyltransferase non-catalytic subunit